MKVIAIHQPNYLPWLGYFYKIWTSDVFVLHDMVEYTKQSYTKRVFIRKSPYAHEQTYLSVPLKKHSDFSLIKDLQINHEQKWQAKHINKIYNSYHRAPYFRYYFPQIEQTLLSSETILDLKTLNQKLIAHVMDCLNIHTLIVSSSKLPLQGFKADEYNAAIVQYLQGDIYMSGTGAQKYQTERAYNRLNIDLKYNNLSQYLKRHPPQYPAPFFAGLSILDALFYIGQQGILAIFNACQEESEKKAIGAFIS